MTQNSSKKQDIEDLKEDSQYDYIYAFNDMCTEEDIQPDLKNAASKITEFLYISINNSKPFNLKDLEVYCKQHISPNISLFDILFLNDEHDCNLLYYLHLENQKHVLDEIFTKYNSKFLTISEDKWNFIFLGKDLYLHTKIKSIYGDNYYKNISNYLNNDEIPMYHPRHLNKLLKAKKLDNFFQTCSIENLMTILDFHLSSSWLLIHVFVAQKQSYINFFSDVKNNKNINLKLPIFILEDKTIVNEYSIRIPEKSILNSHIFNHFGIKNGNTILKEFLEINHNVLIQLITKENDLYKNTKANFPSKDFKNVFKDVKMFNESLLDFITNDKLNKKLVMPIIIEYLNKDPELFSHLIINDIIDKEDLLFNIKKPNFLKNDEFIVLNENLPLPTEQQISRKNKKI